MKDKTIGPKVRATIIKKTLSNKDMLVGEIDTNKYPHGKFKRGKRNFKISNLRQYEHKIGVGTVVEGNLFDYLHYNPGGSPTRLHIQRVIKP